MKEPPPIIVLRLTLGKPRDGGQFAEIIED